MAKIISTYEDVLKCPLVFDFGSGSTKIGMSELLYEIPSLVADSLSININSEKMKFRGDEIEKASGGILDIRSPIKNGIIQNFDDFDYLLELGFQYLRVEPEDRNVVFTENLQNPKSIKEKTSELIFEKYKSGTFSLLKHCVTPLYSYGPLTGVSFTSGDGITECVAIEGGKLIPFTSNSLDFGGNDLTELMIELLAGSWRCCQTFKEKNIAKKIKEICFISMNHSIDTNILEEDPKRYALPDGTIIKLSEEIIKVPEALFEPNLVGIESKGIHDIIYKCIQSSPFIHQEELYQNVFVSGGSTLFNGFNKRLESEISNISSKSFELGSKNKNNQKNASWHGACILSSMSNFDQYQMTKDEYLEYGSKRIHNLM